METALAYYLFAFSKGKIRPEEFILFPPYLKAIYWAFLERYNEDTRQGGE